MGCRGVGEIGVQGLRFKLSGNERWVRRVGFKLWGLFWALHV